MLLNPFQKLRNWYHLLSENEKYTLWVLCLFYLFIIANLNYIGYEDDLNVFWKWVEIIKSKGFVKGYCDADKRTSVINYPVVYGYIIWVIGQVVDNKLEANALGLIKLPPVLFDFATSLLLFFELKRRKLNTMAIFFVAMNFVILYNSYSWGQVESIYTFFIVAAFVALLNNRFNWAAILWLLAVNSKFQAVIFLPFIGYAILLNNGLVIRKWLISIGLVLFLQILLWLPFILTGNLLAMFQIVTNGTVDLFPYTSFYALNHWFFYFNDPSKINDSKLFMGLTLKTWGLALFILNAAIIATPFCYQLAKRKIKGASNLVTDDNILVFILIAIAFFYFPTQMHERYLHPALPLLGIYAIFKKRKMPLYFLLSYCYFVCLEGVLKQRGFDNYGIFLFNPKLIAALILFIYLRLLTQLYKNTFFVKEQTNLQPLSPAKV